MYEVYRRKTTVRDLPLLSLIFGCFLAAAALSIFLLTLPSLPNPTQLRAVSGTIACAPFVTWKNKQAKVLHILVRKENLLYDLSPHEILYGVSGIYDRMMDLKVGDKVLAQVEHNSMGTGDTQLWELHRDGNTILSYRDSLLFFEHRKMRNRLFAGWAAALALMLCLAGILLKKHFGAWHDRQPTALNPSYPV